MVPWPNQGSQYRLELILQAPEFGVLRREWPTDPTQRLAGLAQLNDVFAYFGVGGVATQRAMLYLCALEKNPELVGVFPYATINDNGTSDPLFRYVGNSPADPPFLP